MKNLVTEQGIVKEMTGDVKSLGIEVPFAEGVNIDELTKGDNDPLFVTVEALNPQISKNRRIWSESMIKDVANQIMSKRPDAYQGHIDEKDRQNVTPTAMTIWLGALVKDVEGKARLFIKGYVMPYAKELKQYLKAAKASGKKVAVSVYGQALQKWNSVKKAYDMLQFDLESIDWARPGGEGVPGTGFLQLASEMKKGDVMDREEMLKSVTVSEMKENNVALYDKIFKDGEESGKKSIVKEMSAKLEDAENRVKGFENALPECVEKKPEVVSEMAKSHDNLIENYLDSALSSKKLADGVRSIVRKQVVSEMAGQFRTKELVDSSIEKVLGSEEIKSVVKEMASLKVVNPGEDNRNQEKKSRFINK